MTANKSIAVFGGNGFLGRAICQTGVKLGYNMTSFSRSGNPPATIMNQPWAKKVNWEKADIFDPKSYSKKLSQFNTVIHSIGILFENQSYKKSINSNFNFLNDLQEFSNAIKGSNPMEKTKNSTYAAIQRDTAVILADAFLKEQHNNPSYVYISADRQIPLLPSNYLITKREAEFELSCKKGLRSIFMRPGFMYEEGNHQFNNRDLLKNIFKLGYATKNLVLGDSIGILNELVRPPVSTEKVSLKIFEKLEDENFSGVVSLDEINSN